MAHRITTLLTTALLAAAPLSAAAPAGSAAAVSPGSVTTGSGAVTAGTAARSTERVGTLPPFTVENFPLTRVPQDQMPLMVGKIAVDHGRPTSGGIVKYRHRTTGVLYDHPVMQSTHIMGWLAQYEATGDRRLLDLAIRHGAHLRANAVTEKGALFFPYPFDFALHGDTALTLKGPWYSAMAQGEVLSAYLRLYTVTGDKQWMDAARGTFKSFTVGHVAGRPWVVDVIGGRLWLEEYPDEKHPDRAFNGHNFALFGIYEYWWHTKDPDAATLLRGAMTASLDRAGDIRRPGEVSRYCLAHDVRSVSYHGIHILQLNSLYRITGDLRFAHWSDRFLADAPRQYGGGSGRLAWGTHTLLSTNAAGKVTSTTTVRPTRATTVTYDRRERITGQPGLWLRFGAGPNKGRWVREAPGRAFVTGRQDELSFEPQRTFTVAAGRYTAYRADARGRRAPGRTITFSATSSAAAKGRVVIDGAPYLIVANGALGGMYLPLDSRVTLR